MSELYTYHARCEDCPAPGTGVQREGRGARDEWVEQHKRKTGHRWFKRWKVSN